MRDRRSSPLWSVLVALALLGAACSSPESAEPGSSATGSGASEEDADAHSSGEKEEGEKADKPKGDERKKRNSGAKPGSGAETPGATPGASEDGDGGDESTSSDDGDDGSGDDDGGGGGENSPAAGAVRFPAGGTYTYAQNGYEEFCGGPSCDRQPLPSSQRVTNVVKKRSSSSVTVVSEARASDKRLMRTTTRFGRERADIVYLVSKFEYGNFRFSESYAPQPPILAMSFPFAAGQGWDGSWHGESSGTYTVSVEGREQVQAAGRSISAYKVVMNIRVEADYNARIDLGLWIDPETNLPVKTSGSINASNAFGSYESVFQTTLSSGPGY